MSLAANLIPYASLFQMLLPRETLPVISRLSGNILASIQNTRKKIVRKNLDMIGVPVTEKIVADTIRNWTYCIFDQLQSLWMRSRDLLSMVDDQGGSAKIAETMRNGKGAVLVTAHLGNYELAGSYLALKGFPVYAVVEEIPGSHTRAVNRIRRRFGMGVISYSDTAGMLEVLRAGKILVLLADRDLEGNGLAVDFGKSRRRIPIGPALLSLRTGAPIQAGYFVLVKGRSKYIFNMNKRIKPPKGDLRKSITDLTVKMSGQLVRMILASPDQWFCFQDDP